MVCLQRSEDSFWERLLCFHYVGPKEWTSVLKLGENLYLLGCLASAQTLFIQPRSRVLYEAHCSNTGFSSHHLFQGHPSLLVPLLPLLPLIHAQILLWTSGSVPLPVRIPLTCLSENSNFFKMSWSFPNASLSTTAHGDPILWTNPTLSLSTTSSGFLSIYFLKHPVLTRIHQLYSFTVWLGPSSLTFTNRGFWFSALISTRIYLPPNLLGFFHSRTFSADSGKS